MAQPKSIKEDGRVFHLTKIEVTTIYKHPLYALEYQDTAALGPTGAWSVIVIKHASGWPVYKGRWDEKADAFDIDKFPDSKSKAVKNFQGHHTKKSKGSFHQFEIAIEDPKSLFTGIISFHVTRKLVTRGSLRMSGKLTLTVIKTGDK